MSGAAPISPRVLRGAIIGVDLFDPVASVIIFQYNPETLTRTLQAQTTSDSGAHVEVLRLKGAPIETIKLDAEIDATDQLEAGDTITELAGIHPQLAALEMLIYPKLVVVAKNTIRAIAGSTNIIAPQAPFTLLVWGYKRVVPVRLTDLTITEEAYDPNLNPIRAKVALSLRVLSYNDFEVTHPGYAIFVAHQAAKEALAITASARSVAAAGTLDVKLF